MTKRHVYFIEAGEGGPIKIGVAANVTARLKDLQSANPARLQIIVTVPGDHTDERRLHRRFKAERVGGEWFNAIGAVRDLAASLVGMTETDRIVAIKHDEPTKPKLRRGPLARKRYTPEEWLALFTVGDGTGGIYRSAEAETALLEREKRYRR